MGTSLTGKNISASYLGLLKSTDNLAISTSAKTITDGAGNDLPIKLSTAQFLVSDGSVSAPTIGFSNETNTGFYHTTGEINATIAGTNKITIDGSQTHIKGSTLLIDSSDDSGRLQFNYGPATNSRSWRILNDNISDGDFWIGFSDTRTSTSYQTALNINKDGNIALGGGSASSVYDISLGGNTFITASNTTALKINRGASYGDILELQSQGGVFAQFSGIEAGTTRILKIDGYDTDSEIRLSTSGSNRFIIDTNGNVRFNSYGGGTITGTATQRLGVDLNGNVIEIPIGAGAVDGAGATGQASFWTDSDTISGDDDFYWDNTNKRLGIATTSPTASLQIENTSSGNATVGAFLVNSSTTLNTEVRLAFASHTNSDIATNRYSYISTINTSGSNGQDMIFATNATGAGGSEAMRIDSSGNVGIGCTPTDKLEIGTTSSGGNLRLVSSAYASNGLARFFAPDGNEKLQIGTLSSTSAYIYTPASTDLAIYTGGSEKARLDSDGNLGINEDNPSAKLHISETTTWGSMSNPIINIENSGTGGNVNVPHNMGSITWKSGTVSTAEIQAIRNTPASGNDVELRFLTANAGVQGTRMTINKSGDVGIGESNPLAPLHISSNNGAIARFANNSATLTTTFLNVINANDTSNGTVIAHIDDGTSYIGNQQNNALRLVTNDTERMRIDSSGLVSISNLGVPTLRLNNTDTSLAAQTLGAIEFYQNDPSATGVGVVSKISSVNESSFEGNAGMRFYTGTAGDLRERLHITAGGEIGIGCTPTNIFEVQPTSGCLFSFTGSSTSLYTTTFDIDNDGLSIGHNSAVRKFYLKTNGLKRITITGGGSVGIGTENPDRELDVENATDNCVISAVSGTASIAGLVLGDTDDDDEGGILYNNSQNYLYFQSGASERARITSGGYLKASNNGTYYSSTGSIHELRSSTTNNATAIISHTGASPYGLFVYHNTDVNNTTNYFFGAGAGANDRFFVYSNGNVVNSNNSYGAISDVKLKENITDASHKLDDLLQVKVRNFNYIGDDKKQLGVIAQELEEIFPSMIDESPDFKEQEVPQLDENEQEVLDENGDVVMTTKKVDLGTTTKSVKYSVFVPMLIKAMQEQQDMIQELKAEIDELKKKV